MISVVLIGTGNVAQNLFLALKEAPQVTIKQVVGRNKNKLDFASANYATTTNFKKVEKANVYILAISDGAIEKVSKTLNIDDGIVVHTSGATDINKLQNQDKFGVFYPLQTFTKGKMISFKEIPICIEANSEEDYKVLEKLAESLSKNVVQISSKERKKLHVAAVFANNFTNYMYSLSKEICEEYHLDFELLKPLINETAAKLNSLSPREAQTGPAIRGDQQTLHNHLALIKDKQKRELYTLLSNAIKLDYGKEL